MTMEKQNAETTEPQNAEFPVHVSNLADYVRRDDLRALFRRFGYITRLYLPTDRTTGLCQGYAFVNFANEEDAEAAIEALDGYGFENQFLRVRTAKPRAPKDTLPVKN